MEAHNGLSAKLAQEAGFEALWGSGLSISAALGVRDSNEASWTQVLEVLEFMADATDLPILLDGDTGYGNFNNVRRLVRKLEQRGVAGVCLEDKLFPKTNSFIDGDRQMLAEVDEFCGRIRAGKDTQRDPAFQIVARTEALIAGWGVQEALLRASAYAESGADCILVHSAKKDSAEILAFMEHWTKETPIVIVPTKYPTEPIAKFVDNRIYNFIFANQALRTVITALQKNLARLHQTRDLMSIEAEIAPVNEVFRLQNVQELKRSEGLYLPSKGAERPRAVVLAATKGNLGALVADRPKSMVFLRGKPILGWQIEAFNRQGIRDIGVVRGYKKEAMSLPGLAYFDNDQHAETGELYSLYAARDFLKGDLLIAYGDVIFDDFILGNLLNGPGDIRLAVDAAWKLRDRQDPKRDLVQGVGRESPLGDLCTLVAIGSGLDREQVTGEFIGLLRLRAKGTEAVTALLDQLARDEPEVLRTANLDLLLTRLVTAGQTVAVVPTFGHWSDVDEQADLQSVENEV